MSNLELSEIYEYFVQGVGVGFIFSAFPFVIGIVVNFLIGIIDRS